MLTLDAGRIELIYLRHDTSRANRTPITNRNTGQDYNIPCYPAILPNCNTTTHFRAISPIAQIRVKRMGAAEKRHIGADEGPRSDWHFAGIKECTIEVDKHVASDFDVRSVVDVDRSFYPGIVMQHGIFILFCGGRR